MNVQLRIPSRLYDELVSHLFPGDMDEHGAILLAGYARQGEGLTLLARELHLAQGDEFVPGTFGYRQLSPLMVAKTAGRADSEHLVYLSCHSHPGATSRVSFSVDDLRAHERLFPHLFDLTEAPLVGGLVFGTESVAGDIWASEGGRLKLEKTTVVGPNLLTLTAEPKHVRLTVEDRFDRQVRLFGEEGQRRLRKLHVGVIGAGGGGSLIVEQLAHLGVGELTVVDFDRIDATNLSRVVGATAQDASQRTKKVDVLRRLVTQVDSSIRYRGIDGDIVDGPVAEALVACDFLFLATDTTRSRLVFNAIVHQYLIPGVQIGAKVEVASDGSIEEIYVAVRPVLPSQGCLDCAGLIDPFALHREQRTEEEELAQNYIGAAAGEAVVDPSVISLNSISAAHGVTDMLLATVGLARASAFDHRLFFPRDGSSFTVSVPRREDCLFCGAQSESALARGDGRALPVKTSFFAADDLLGRPRSSGSVHRRMAAWSQLLARFAHSLSRR